MKAGSLFAGIGGFDLALRNQGVEVVWQVEKEPQCHSVLEHRFPECKLYEDVRDVGAGVLEPVELVVGGFPCQGLSVAGLREGLDDERSGLWYEFHRILAEITPHWVLIENVPGLLSSDGGRDMAVVLRGLADLGYWWTYRILDSQYFNVPQRRARVFIVGRYGGPCPPEILFEPESVFRDPAARRAERETAARGSAQGTASSGGGGDQGGSDPDPSTGTEGSRITSGPDGISGAVSAKWVKGTGGPEGDEAYNLVVTPFDSTQITSALNYSNPKPGDPCHPLAESGHAPKIAGVNVYPEAGQGADLIARETDTAMTLTPNSGERRTDRGTFVFKASHFTRGKDGAPDTVTPPLSADADKGDQDLLVQDQASTLVSPHKQWNSFQNLPNLPIDSGFVRRLTPRECERLQGFPDDWTLVEHDGKPLRDGPRLRMLGNAVTVPVVEWIVARLLKFGD